MCSKAGRCKISRCRTRKGQGFFGCEESSWEQWGSIGRAKYEFSSLKKYYLRLTWEEKTYSKKQQQKLPKFQSYSPMSRHRKVSPQPSVSINLFRSTLTYFVVGFPKEKDNSTKKSQNNNNKQSHPSMYPNVSSPSSSWRATSEERSYSQILA